MAIPAALDEYIHQTVCYSLGLPVPQEFLLEKLTQAEESKRDLEAQVHSLQRRLVELEHRLKKSKDEASLNALALRRHVGENQKLVGQVKQISQRCAWLEDECSLYLKDREVFMGVADEAEERAFKAEERAVEAEKQVAELFSEANRLKQIELQHAEWEEDIARLRSEVTHLESKKSSLELELVTVEATAKGNLEVADREELPEGRAGIASPVLSRFFKERGENVSTTPEVQKAEFWVCKNRQGTIEQHLMAEVQKLWQEVALYKCNLAKSEIQIQILTDDNKDLRLALRKKCSKSPSPVSKLGLNGSSKLQSKSLSDLFRSDLNPRQPLVPLESNLLDLRSTHCLN